MATLTIKESREFVIFQAFAQNSTFQGALSVLEDYDRNNPNRRIFAAPDEKKAMRESFAIFKEAENIISRNGTKLDYDNPQIMERLKTILSQKLPAISRDTFKDATSSVAINKANVGRMMALHAYNVKTLGKKLMQEIRDNSHVQAMVEKYGKLGTSPHKEVFAQDTSYKSNQEVVRDRVLDEQKKQRA